MKTTAPIGHRDPRTEVVPVTYLRLSADLIVTARQDLDYWRSVPVPSRPSDRVPFEELRQIAVFLPLVLVALAFTHLHLTAAFVTLLAVLPLMKLQHKSLSTAIAAQATQWHRRDCGRYAFTIHMCEEFGLHPEEVTMALVLKMCSDFQIWLAAAKRVSARDEEARCKARRFVANEISIEYEALPSSGRSTTSAYAPDATVLSEGPGSTMPTINPATGLPMIDTVSDVHGNVFGTSNFDDMLHDVHHEHSVDTNITSTGADFNAPHFGGFGAEC